MRQEQSHRECSTPWARAYYPKLEQLLAEGRHPDDAAWEARQYALTVQEREISGSEAAYNATVVAALGLTSGSATTEPEEADVAVDWDSIIASLNADRQ